MASHSLTRRGPRKSDEDLRVAFPRAISATMVEATCDTGEFTCRAAPVDLDHELGEFPAELRRREGARPVEAAR